jgi:DNA-binding beta-propeller fold protein YncE
MTAPAGIETPRCGSSTRGITRSTSAPTVLPFAGLDRPARVAVDTAGNVYVVDGGHRRVLKLAPEGS